MIRGLAARLARVLAALATIGFASASPAYAQAQDAAPPDTSFPVVPALLAVLATGIILFVICVPSGKEQ